MKQVLNSRDCLEEKVKKYKYINRELFVLLLMAFTIHVFEIFSAGVKFRRAFKKKIKAEIFLESHVSRHRGPESKAPAIILRFGSALCIILSDGLQHSLIAAGWKPTLAPDRGLLLILSTEVSPVLLDEWEISLSKGHRCKITEWYNPYAAWTVFLTVLFKTKIECRQLKWSTNVDNFNHE